MWMNLAYRDAPEEDLDDFALPSSASRTPRLSVVDRMSGRRPSRRRTLSAASTGRGGGTPLSRTPSKAFYPGELGGTGNLAAPPSPLAGTGNLEDFGDLMYSPGSSFPQGLLGFEVTEEDEEPESDLPVPQSAVPVPVLVQPLRPETSPSVLVTSTAPRTPRTPGGTCDQPPRTRLFRMWRAVNDGRIRSASVHSKGVILPAGAGIDYLEQFKKDCKRKYGSLCGAWRLLIDAGGIGRVSFFAFVPSAKLMGYRNPAKLWAHLDHNRSGFITLECWDPPSSRNLMEFRDICYSQYGGMDTAFKFGMDKNGSATITLPELKVFCKDMEYSGDVAELFDALDENSCGVITADELEFLTRHVGEKFRSSVGDKKALAVSAHLQMTARSTPRGTARSTVKPR